MEYAIVFNNRENEFINKINSLIAEGWDLHGPLSYKPGMLCREMVRYTADPERAKLARDIAEAIENMSLDSSFSIHGTRGSQFEVKRVK